MAALFLLRTALSDHNRLLTRGALTVLQVPLRSLVLQ